MTVRAALAQEVTVAISEAFAGTLCYPMGAAPTPAPDRFTTFQRVGAEHHRHMRSGAGLVSTRFQIDHWARQAADAELMADKTRERLDNLRQSIGESGSMESIQVSLLDAEDQSFEPPVDASGVGHHRVRQDFIIWHPESVTPAA